EVNHSLQRETPRHAGEPPSSPRNSLDLLKRKDIWIRRRCCVAGEAREKTICVGRDEGSRSDSDESAEVNLDVEGHGKSSKLRGISHAAPVYDQGATLYYVSFDCRQGSSEGYLLACQREDTWLICRCCVADEAREETICVGCDEGRRPGADACAEVDLLVKGHGKSAKLRSSSRPAPLYDQEPAYHLATLDRRQRPSEG